MRHINTQTPIPSRKLKGLNKRHAKDYAANVSIPFGELYEVLKEFEDNGEIPIIIKKIWSAIYSRSEPILTEEIQNQVGLNSVSSVNRIFGSFAKKFYIRFKNKFNQSPIEIKSGKGIKCVYTQMFVDIFELDNGLLYFTLRSSFRIALNRIFDDSTIKGWN